MRWSDVPVENKAQIAWGALVVVYLLGAQRPELIRPPVVAVFLLSAAAAFLELWLRSRGWPHLLWYDCIVWSALLTGMVVVTGGRGSEVWAAYILMSLTAPVVLRRVAPYILLGVNVTAYGLIYLLYNPFGAPLDWGLLFLRIGTIFLVAYVVDRSTARERQSHARAVALARSRVSELVQARDAERRRIAHDIHDWLGTGIIAPLRRLEIAARQSDVESCRRHVEEAADSLRRAHAELRRLMENLHPHLLEQMGLAEALRAYLTDWGEEHGVAVHYHLTPGPEPPADAALALYRIQQEALNNCAKHADASQVWVTLELGADRVRLTLRDDGHGRPGRPGRGITGMQERAAAFGGTVTVHGQPGRGTTVTAELPLRAAAAAAPAPTEPF
ncbi:sensor histidine kinase [Symbiobacterium thermophilum]|uniref:histidine kinase n=1 Tax=Symbiobacterium thermophilum (strain DSM 24528 / JCM 14929 / IAM 14863 / T) TaxID=292459 RepID=Q67QN6_SYMTH|nr:sensor histidine kinase [Symbiobacterium thermophilum]BAD40007.1 two-component sensor histidine kinase [Symbiobacterium thermophilum IAM 14863]